MKQLRSWSFSSLMNYERCPYSVAPGSANYSRPRPEAAQRGIEAHKQIEDYLTVKKDLETNPFPDLPFDSFSLQKVICEEKWGLDNNWKPTDYKDAWLKLLLDAYVIDQSLSSFTCYDWKTGKRDGNEVKHTQQMQLYLCVATMKFPTIQNFTSELWYIDHDKIITGKTYTKDQLNPIAQRWDKRGKRMTSDTEFIAKPSKSNCRFCDRAKAQGGNCEYEYET